MRSIWASLRSIVLPWGATTGERLEINLELGRISGYNTTNDEVMRMDVDTGYYTRDTNPVPNEVSLSGGSLSFEQIGDDNVTFYQLGEWGMSENGVNFAYFRQRIGSGASPQFQTTVPIVRDTSWSTLSAENNWSGINYRLLSDTGMVLLDGNVSGGTQTSGITVGTLPVGYRPRSNGEWMVARSGAFGTSKVRVNTTGAIQLFVNDGVWNAYMSGIIFSTLA